uniref:Ras-associating domain-containing protein n=1 Tax=Monopterus albus TaxID=43700 RepID=A0A3Q3JZ23_MONAL
MELKVWVEGVARVVCGLSLNTSCQDVVIALAQDIGQTGRYILIMTLQGNEKQLVADDCPLQILAQLGQLAAEVQFILQRTGPSLSEGQCTPTSGHSIKRLTHRDRQSLSLTPTDSLELPVNLSCMCLDCGRKPEYPERTNAVQTQNFLAVR